MHPGATWPAKRWFPDRYATLANALISGFDAQILLTMGPNEEVLASSVMRSCHFPIIEPELLTLRQLAAVLKFVWVYICNDCGPMHLAPAVGTPTVGIFGPGEPDIWFPYNPSKGHQLIYHQIDCSQCHQDLCEKMDCMKAISVEDVFAAVEKTLTWQGIVK
jgi:ADP-heptose:LPS heptosyltransferase